VTLSNRCACSRGQHTHRLPGGLFRRTLARTKRAADWRPACSPMRGDWKDMMHRPFLASVALIAGLTVGM
jgi:hypothetical protein